MDFSQKLKELRTDKGFTQKEMAETLCITTRAYQNYESGKCFPKRETQLRIAQALGVNSSYLLSFGEGAAETDAPQCTGECAAKKCASSLAAELTELFSQDALCEADKDMIMQSLMDAYWDAKRRARARAARITPSDY